MTQIAEKMQRDQNKTSKISMFNSIRMKMKSGSMSNLSQQNTVGKTSFSAIVSGGTVSRNMTSTVQKKAFASKFKAYIGDDDFKVTL